MLQIPEEELMSRFGITMVNVDPSMALLEFRVKAPDATREIVVSMSVVTKSIHCDLYVGAESISTVHSEALVDLQIWQRSGIAGLLAVCETSQSRTQLAIELTPSLAIRCTTLTR